MLLYNLKSYSKLFSKHTELRVQENRDFQITFVKGNMVKNSMDAASGVSARVCSNGSWGFASSPELKDEVIQAVLKRATENAEFLNIRENKLKEAFVQESFSYENGLYTKRTRFTQKQLVEFVKEVDNYIVKKYPSISNRVITLKTLEMEKNLLTSCGSSLYSMIPRTNFIVSLTIEKNGEPVEASSVSGGLGQFEDLFNSPSDLYGKIDELYVHLVNKSDGVYAEAGIKECILDSKLAGILAHEAIGHTTEADLVLQGSVAGNYLEKQVASSLITLTDFAHSYNGETCPIPIYIDDEGTKAEDIVIIKDGILKSFMHSKESAQYFNVKPSGNARAYRFSDEPLIRMRNTAILPGTSKLSDMIASIEDGYYLMQPSNGQADSTSEFMFGITLGYEIKNGKIGRAIKGTTISGVGFDVLKTVTMVSDDMTWTSGGMCGKKQPIPVGMGGPAIKCNVNIGGE
jgi:TldD protein